MSPLSATMLVSLKSFACESGRGQKVKIRNVLERIKNWFWTAASSVTDSRHYGNFPNTTRTVNGTLIYDVPSADSRKGGAPQDSRTSVPVDSRTAPSKPQNSRT